MDVNDVFQLVHFDKFGGKFREVWEVSKRSVSTMSPWAVAVLCQEGSLKAAMPEKNFLGKLRGMGRRNLGSINKMNNKFINQTETETVYVCDFNVYNI